MTTSRNTAAQKVCRQCGEPWPCDIVGRLQDKTKSSIDWSLKELIREAAAEIVRLRAVSLLEKDGDK